MPKLWSATVEEHRREVREAVIDAAATLVAERGLRAVTMAQIAERSGIGRATLYKYFSDVDSMVAAWHERQVTSHVAQLVQLAERPGTPLERLTAVLERYASIAYGRPSGEAAATLHSGTQIAHAQAQLRELFESLLAHAATDGTVREDVAPKELSRYCVQSLSGATGLPSVAAVGRLVRVTLDGLRAR